MPEGPNFSARPSEHLSSLRQNALTPPLSTTGNIHLQQPRKISMSLKSSEPTVGYLAKCHMAYLSNIRNILFGKLSALAEQSTENRFGVYNLVNACSVQILRIVVFASGMGNSWFPPDRCILC